MSINLNPDRYSKDIEDQLVEVARNTFFAFPLVAQSLVDVLMGSSEIDPENHDQNEIIKNIMRFMSVPTTGETHIDRLYNMLRLAQCAFTNRDCKTPTREEVLTGMLIARISTFARSCSNESRLRSRTTKATEVFVIDLNVASREARTGGDVAFIFQVGDNKYVASCLQAKRVGISNSIKTKIKRSNSDDKDGTHQIVALRKLQEKCNISASYIFYCNDTYSCLENPFLPIVKPVDFLEEDVETTVETDVGCDSLDFASYVVHLAIDENKHVDENGLVPIMGALAEQRISEIVCVASGMPLVLKNTLRTMHSTWRELDPRGRFPSRQLPSDLFKAHSKFHRAVDPSTPIPKYQPKGMGQR